MMDGLIGSGALEICVALGWFVLGTVDIITGGTGLAVGLFSQVIAGPVGVILAGMTVTLGF